MFERKTSMKRVLLDTNVILDFLLKRESNYEDAQTIIKRQKILILSFHMILFII